MTVQELYESRIKFLTATERLQLATIILKEIPPQAVVDYREEWSDEDMADLKKEAWRKIETAFEDEPDYA